MYIGTTPPDYILNLDPTIVPASVAIACGIAYQVAGFPTGFVFQALKWVKIDMKQTGPRSIDESDLLHAGKPLLAFITLIADMIKSPFAIIAGITFGALYLKSYVVVGSGQHVCIPELSLYMLFLPPIAALIGHQYPLWFNFRGGRGFGPAFAIYLFMDQSAGLALGLTWIAVFAITRYFSAAAIVSMLSAPLWAWLFASGVWLEAPDVTGHFALMSSVLAALVIFKYRDSIRRLRDGTEPIWQWHGFKSTHPQAGH